MNILSRTIKILIGKLKANFSANKHTVQTTWANDNTFYVRMRATWCHNLFVFPTLTCTVDWREKHTVRSHLAISNYKSQFIFIIFSIVFSSFLSLDFTESFHRKLFVCTWAPHRDVQSVFIAHSSEIIKVISLRLGIHFNYFVYDKKKIVNWSIARNSSSSRST